MIMRVLSTGLLAGFVAGLAIAVLQNFSTTPLILQAEVFENAAEKAASSAPWRAAQAFAGEEQARVILVHADHDHAAGGEEEWGPADGVERIFYTSTATVATAIGFALLLIGAMLASGRTITERSALAFAAAGFVATGLAPAAGLSPELPGMPAAELLARQGWWIGTALSTAAALWLFLTTERTAFRALAVLLLLAPHAIGAPHLATPEASRVPPELAARFAGVSLAVQASLWIATGIAVAWFWQKLGRSVSAEGSPGGSPQGA